MINDDEKPEDEDIGGREDIRCENTEKHKHRGTGNREAETVCETASVRPAPNNASWEKT